MSSTKRKPPKLRNPFAEHARRRKAGPMKHKNEPKGGAKREDYEEEKSDTWKEMLSVDDEADARIDKMMARHRATKWCYKVSSISDHKMVSINNNKDRRVTLTFDAGGMLHMYVSGWDYVLHEWSQDNYVVSLFPEDYNRMAQFIETRPSKSQMKRITVMRNGEL